MMCPACEGSLDDHDEGCPQDAIRKYVDGMATQYHICPVCRDRRVRPNRDDFYECPKCNTTYTTSEVGGGEGPPLLLFKANLESHATVLKRSEKGTGDFRDKEVLKSLRHQVQEARRRRAQ